jgi:hypothetical protein
VVSSTAAIGFYCRSNVLQTADCRRLLLTGGRDGVFCIGPDVGRGLHDIRNGIVKNKWSIPFQVIHMGRYILVCWLTENSSAKFPISGPKKNRIGGIAQSMLGRSFCALGPPRNENKGGSKDRRKGRNQLPSSQYRPRILLACHLQGLLKV